MRTDPRRSRANHLKQGSACSSDRAATRTGAEVGERRSVSTAISKFCIMQRGDLLLALVLAAAGIQWVSGAGYSGKGKSETESLHSGTCPGPSGGVCSGPAPALVPDSLRPLRSSSASLSEAVANGSWEECPTVRGLSRDDVRQGLRRRGGWLTHTATCPADTPPLRPGRDRNAIDWPRPPTVCTDTLLTFSAVDFSDVSAHS